MEGEVAARSNPTRGQSDRPMRLPRTTGALAGILTILLGAWGALIPFVGPYFHYAFGNYDSWHLTANRVWLDVLPGVLAVVGGWLLLYSTRRVSGLMAVGWRSRPASGSRSVRR